MLAVLVLYFVPKYATYVVWCYLGLKKFRPEGEDQQNTAYLYGFYRLLIGFGFGVLVFLAVLILAPGSGDSAAGGNLAYFCVYFPVRWVEWTIMSVLIIPGSDTILHCLSGVHRRDRLWRLGGIGLSFLADLPLLIIIDGFRVGRILC